MGTLSPLSPLGWSEHALNLLIHAIVILLVPVLLLFVFLAARLTTQMALYLTDSWSLMGLPRYKEPLGAWKMMWNRFNWTEFCEKMRRRDGSFHPMLNCGPSVEGRHWVAISAPQLISTVLSSPEPDEETSALYAKLRTASPTFADAYTAWIGEGLLSAEGTKWHIHRKACTPLFFSTLLHAQLNYMIRSAHTLIRDIRLQKKSNSSASLYSSPTELIGAHVMRNLLRLVASEDIIQGSRSPDSKKFVSWMIAQQHELAQQFRFSLEKTSFLGGRVWKILGGPISSMLPWVGGVGNLHELQAIRGKLARYYQGLINRLRYEEEEEPESLPSQAQDLLSMLFYLKLDEDYAIRYKLPKSKPVLPTETPRAPSSPSNTHTPTPPLPSRRNLLMKSHSGLKKSAMSMILTPPSSSDPATSSKASVLSVGNSPTLSVHLLPAEPVDDLSPQAVPFSASPAPSPHYSPLPPAPYQSDGPLHQKSKKFKVTNMTSCVTNASPTPPQETNFEHESLSSASSSPEQQTDLSTPGSSKSTITSSSFTETVEDWSDEDCSDVDEPLEEQDARMEGDRTTQGSWSTMPFNSDADNFDEEDTDCEPGSQPHRPGHLPDETIIDQALSFIAAGFQPTTSTIEWCIYHLAKDPELHVRLQGEAHFILDGYIPQIMTRSSHPDLDQDPKDATKKTRSLAEFGRHGSGLGIGDIMPSPKQIAQLNLTRNFVKEVLRMHPTQPVVERITTADVELGGRKIPEGTAIGLMIWNVHRDPTLWPNPDQFWPERFETYQEGEERKLRGGPSEPFAYIPFAGGNHSCIAQKYAMQLLVVTVALLVRAFDVELCPNTKTEESCFDGVLSPIPLNIRFLPRDLVPKSKSASSSPQATRPTGKDPLSSPRHEPVGDSSIPATVTAGSSSPTVKRRKFTPM